MKIKTITWMLCLLLTSYCQLGIAQNDLLHVEGNIRSDSLAGLQGRVVAVDADGTMRVAIDGDICVNNRLVLKDANGKERFVFDPDSVRMQMLDDDGNVFFTLASVDSSSNFTGSSVAKNNKNLMNNGGFEFFFNEETNTMQQITSDGNGNITTVDFEPDSYGLRQEDPNGVTRYEVNAGGSPSGSFAFETLSNSAGNQVTSRNLNENGADYKFFDGNGNQISAAEFNANAMAFIKGDNKTEVNEFGTKSIDISTGQQSFFDIFGISNINNSGFTGLNLNPNTQQVTTEGDHDVTGTITKSAGMFKIDHPLDPTNKWLIHSFVESDEMKNVYDGNVVTDVNGEAKVQLPLYFDALNKNFRYQLTVIGTFAQAIILEEIQNNQFKIKTSEPNVKVSWQVTGVRQDAYVKNNPMIVEMEKTGWDKGKLRYDPKRKEPYSEGLREHWRRRKVMNDK